MAERWEWVEIIEPRTKEHMYANLTTGECVWEPPPNVKIKTTDDNQWWELYDSNTSRFYYYNATSQKTVWHRPQNCDIIPLAKLQTLKQNTEVRDDDDENKIPKEKREISTQTPDRKKHDHHGRTSASVRSSAHAQASPRSSRRHHHHHHKSGGQSSGRYDRVDQLLNGDRHNRRQHDQASETTPQKILESPRSSRRTKESSRHAEPNIAISRRDSLPLEEKPDSQALSFEPLSKTLSREHTRHEAHPAFQRQGSFSQDHYTRHDYSDLALPRSDSFTRESSKTLENFQRQDSLTSRQHPSEFSTNTGTDVGFTHSTESAFLSQNQRPRRFPRTNPSYMPRREGHHSFRKVSSEQAPNQSHIISPSSDQKYVDGGGQYDTSPARPPPPISISNIISNASQVQTTHSSQTVHNYDNDSGYIDVRGRHERSDSDLSHSSFRGFHERTGSQTSQNSLTKHLHERSDSHSSHSSLKNTIDSYSSQGSLRSGEQHEQSPYNSPSHSNSHNASNVNINPVLEILNSIACETDFPVDNSTTYQNQKDLSGDDYVSKDVYQNEPVREVCIDNVPDISDSNVQFYLARASDPQEQIYANFPLMSTEDEYKSNIEETTITIIDSTSEENSQNISDNKAYSNRSDSSRYIDNEQEFSKENHNYLKHRQTFMEQTKNFEEKEKQKLTKETQNYLKEKQSLIERNEDSLDKKQHVTNPDNISTLNNRPGSAKSESTPNTTNSFSEGPVEQSYEDSVSESSSVFSTPSPKTKLKIPLPPKVPLQSMHASLKRKKNGTDKLDSGMTTLEKSTSLQQDLTLQRPLSLVVSQSDVNMGTLSGTSGSTLSRQGRAGTTGGIRSSEPLTLKGRKPASDSDLGHFVHENLNLHKKGLLGKKMSMSSMLEWSKDPIQKPMIRTADKTVKKEAPEIFKLIQTYMGDRKSKQGDPLVALEIVTKGWIIQSLRDEIFIQLSRQTTGNTKEDGLQLGWELISICLAFFPPTATFQEFLVSYITKHTEISIDPPTMAPVDTRLKLLMSSYYQVPISHFAQICLRRLEKISQSGPKKGVKKPTLDEVEQAKRSIYHPSMFGHMLQDIMAMQSHRFPDRKLPWIQTTLSEEVLRLNGAQTEGIFRVPGDIDDVNALKLKFDQWIPPSDISDPHVPASLLKQWYRELMEPLIPPDIYDECMENFDNAETAVKIVHELPDINRLVLSYLIRFLQVFAAPENAAVTKMDVNNLAMVMAPNCLRCQSDDPRIILENTRKEMAFLRTLIQNLDTSFMEGII